TPVPPQCAGPADRRREVSRRAAQSKNPSRARAVRSRARQRTGRSGRRRAWALFDRKAGELRRPLLRGALRLANESVQPLLDGGDEGGDVALPALGLELHAPVGQVRDETGDLKLLGGLQRRVTKAHPLHLAGEKNCRVM